MVLIGAAREHERPREDIDGERLRPTKHTWPEAAYRANGKLFIGQRPKTEIDKYAGMTVAAVLGMAKHGHVIKVSAGRTASYCKRGQEKSSTVWTAPFQDRCLSSPSLPTPKPGADEHFNQHRKQWANARRWSWGLGEGDSFNMRRLAAPEQASSALPGKTSCTMERRHTRAQRQ